MLSMDAGAEQARAAMPVCQYRPSVCHADTSDVHKGDYVQLSCPRPKLPGLYKELKLNNF